MHPHQAAAAGALHLPLRVHPMSPSLPAFQVHTMGGHSVVSDAQEAEALFDLARESANAADFAGKLQAAGLMPSSGSSSSGSTGGGAGGSSTGSSSGGSSSGKGSERGGSKDGKPSQAGGDSGSGKEQYRVPQLSRELAHKYARDGIIIVTWWVCGCECGVVGRHVTGSASGAGLGWAGRRA